MLVTERMTLSKPFDVNDKERTGTSRSGRLRKKSSKLMYFDSSNNVVKNKKREKKSFKLRKLKSKFEEKENARYNQTRMVVNNSTRNNFQKRCNTQQIILNDSQLVGRKVKMETPSEVSLQSHESVTDSTLSNEVFGTPDYTTYDDDSKDSDDELLFLNMRMQNKKSIISLPSTMSITGRESTLPKTIIYTGYKLWSDEIEKEMFNKYPDIDITIMTVRLGEMWTQLSVKERNNWHSKAQQLSEKNISQNKLVLGCDKKDWLSSWNKKKSKILPPSFEESLRTIDIQSIDVAAHLKLLGESLMLIGTNLEQRKKPVVTSDCMTALLDSLLCAIGSLICLTQQESFTKLENRLTFLSTLENMAYIMPGL